MSDRTSALARLEEHLDRHGADLALWPDPQAASEARRLILAMPAARRVYEAARALEADLAALRQGLDARIAASGAAARVEAAVLAGLPALLPSPRRMRRLAAAMALVWLAGVGLGLAAPAPPAADEIDQLLVEPLLQDMESLELS
jgi:hypothetical protein